ncbi:MAG: zinc ribbon domain-containing protein [Phycisphaerae bacterium]|jgi:hypothetical protein
MTSRTWTTVLYNTIAVVAMVLLLFHWEHVQALASVGRMERPTALATRVGDWAAMHLPGAAGPVPRRAGAVVRSWPATELVFSAIATRDASDVWQRLRFFAGATDLLRISFFVHAATCAVCLLWWRRLRRHAAATARLLPSTAALMFVTLPVLPVAVAWGYLAQVVWARVNWVYAMEPTLAGTRPMPSITDASLMVVCLSGVALYAAMMLLMTPPLARILDEVLGVQRAAARLCPGCGYELPDVDATCPECGTTSQAHARLRQHVRRAGRVTAGLAVGLVALSILLSLAPFAPVW